MKAHLLRPRKGWTPADSERRLAVRLASARHIGLERFRGQLLATWWQRDRALMRAEARLEAARGRLAVASAAVGDKNRHAALARVECLRALVAVLSADRDRAAVAAQDRTARVLVAEARVEVKAVCEALGTLRRARQRLDSILRTADMQFPWGSQEALRVGYAAGAYDHVPTDCKGPTEPVGRATLFACECAARAQRR